MVYRIYVERKEGLDHGAEALKKDLKDLLGIKGIEELRTYNRYDVENISAELFENSVKTVFSEPQTDNTYTDCPMGDVVFAVEYLPGQFDARAASAAECIQIISKGDRPDVRTATVYVLNGNISEDEVQSIKKYVINPVEAREASLDEVKTLKTDYTIPTEVEILDGFCALSREELQKFIDDRGLAMDIDDILFCQQYFVGEKREPTITEIKMIDTYWSDHCRHTTFLTTIDDVKFEDELLQKTYDEYINDRKALGRTKPVNLMDIATLATRVLKKAGKLPKLDESEEINACTVKIDVMKDGKEEKWLLLFKNETHNHPTEIEPFGGAATCIGGAIRDPLSGRSYVYAAMRVTGAGDPTVPVSETLQGKLPQRKIVTTAANGYSSYGNQIGLATGQVDEIYHDGYVAKRMEIGAVIAAAPEENVRRERPEDGDIVILLGGRTGRTVAAVQQVLLNRITFLLLKTVAQKYRRVMLLRKESFSVSSVTRRFHVLSNVVTTLVQAVCLLLSVSLLTVLKSTLMLFQRNTMALTELSLQSANLRKEWPLWLKAKMLKNSVLLRKRKTSKQLLLQLLRQILILQ